MEPEPYKDDPCSQPRAVFNCYIPPCGMLERLAEPFTNVTFVLDEMLDCQTGNIDADEALWTAQFESSKGVLEELFDEGRDEYLAGRTIPLN